VTSYSQTQGQPLHEPLLTEDPTRFALHPIQYQDIWDMYLKQVANFWTTEEIDLAQDLKDWETLNEDEKFFISRILAFFAAR
jgi:ribonucleotide reductase beta subunit family protein with ferritin-like domain